MTGMENIPHYQAVVDIGSNSVRLVIYRGAVPVLNEKATCGLGKHFEDDGSLTVSAKADTLATLRRFNTLIAEQQFTDSPLPVTAFATEAMRRATDGNAFCAEASEALGHKINIISGEAEAEAAAQGVAWSFPQASGISADLGGASLDIASINSSDISPTSLPIGVLRLAEMAEQQQIHAVQQHIKNALQDVSGKNCPVDGSDASNLYLVGGSWRAIARLHLRLQDYPLDLPHGYRCTVEDLQPTLECIEQQAWPEGSVPKSRAALLPYATMVLQQLVATLPCRKLVFCSVGVREGIITLAEEPWLTPQQQQLFEWLAPLSPSPLLYYWRDLAWTTLGNRQAGLLAAQAMLYLGDLRLGQQDRAFLARVAATRHHAKTTLLSDGLLSAETLQQAHILGMGLRLALTLHGGAIAPLSATPLIMAGGIPRVVGEANLLSQLLNGSAAKRLTELQSAF